MQATPEYSTWSAIAKASAKVVFRWRSGTDLWFGMMRSVSTPFCNLRSWSSAVRMRRLTFEMERLGHDADGQDAHLRAVRAITGAAPVPVPPPIAER